MNLRLNESQILSCWWWTTTWFLLTNSLNQFLFHGKTCGVRRRIINIKFAMKELVFCIWTVCKPGLENSALMLDHNTANHYIIKTDLMVMKCDWRKLAIHWPCLFTLWGRTVFSCKSAQLENHWKSALGYFLFFISCCSALLLKVEATDEQIDIEKLKVRDKIHFYGDLVLYEDELHDSGCSMLGVKIVSLNICYPLLRWSRGLFHVGTKYVWLHVSYIYICL